MSKLHYDLKEKKRPVWGSVGGFYKRFRPPPARPRRPLRLIYTDTPCCITPFNAVILHDGNTTMDIDDPRVEENLDELTGTLAKSGDPGFIKDLLRCLLTPAEAADIAARWALVKALKQNIPQRKIARELGISLCKIVRGSRELKKPQSAFQKIFTPECSSGEYCAKEPSP